MKKLSKVFLLVATLSPVAAHGQAEISLDAEGNDGLTWVYTGFYNNTDPLSVSGSLTVPTYAGQIAACEGAASLITHSFSIESVATGIGTGGGGSVQIEDTLVFNKSGVITIGIAPLLMAQVGGSASAFASVAESFSGGGFNYLDDEEVSNGPSGQTINTNLRDGTSDTGTYNRLFSNLQFTVDVTAGTKYTVMSSAAGDSGPSADGLGGLLPVGPGFTAAGGVDPTWYLTTSAGQTYTTGSGYQIAPEPAPMAILGLGAGTLLVCGLKRRR